MQDPADVRFFTALQQVLAGNDTVDCESCRAAVDRAIETGAPLDMRAARASIEALPPEHREKVMAQVHARMAGDLSAIWDLMPNAPDVQKPN